jgi:hypothetical protein
MSDLGNRARSLKLTWPPTKKSKVLSGSRTARVTAPRREPSERRQKHGFSFVSRGIDLNRKKARVLVEEIKSRSEIRVLAICVRGLDFLVA